MVTRQRVIEKADVRAEIARLNRKPPKAQKAAQAD
jgi:hypothetical protein